MESVARGTGGHSVTGRSAADREPTLAELAAIEAEWSEIAADLAAVEDQIVALYAEDASELARRRLRRREARLSRALAEQADRRLGGAA
jgi:hypothetical protein